MSDNTLVQEVSDELWAGYMRTLRIHGPYSAEATEAYNRWHDAAGLYAPFAACVAAGVL